MQTNGSSCGFEFSVSTVWTWKQDCGHESLFRMQTGVIIHVVDNKQSFDQNIEMVFVLNFVMNLWRKTFRSLKARLLMKDHEVMSFSTKKYGPCQFCCCQQQCQQHFLSSLLSKLTRSKPLLLMWSYNCQALVLCPVPLDPILILNPKKFKNQKSNWELGWQSRIFWRIEKLPLIHLIL